MRRFFAGRKHALLLLLGAILLCAASLACACTGYTNFVRLSQRTTVSIATHTTPSPPVQLPHVPSFEAGIAYPQWTADGYSKSDTCWTEGLQNITTQTHAYWIEMPLLFYQTSLSATTVTTGVSTPTIASFVEGIQTAHARGYRVFVTPLLTISSGSIATKLGKPVLISEIGYHNSADVLYHTWETSSTTPIDPTEQTAACNAALANATQDAHISGIFFWGWDDVGAFALYGQPAASVLGHWYSELKS